MNVQNSNNSFIREEGPLDVVKHSGAFGGTGTQYNPLRLNYRSYTALIEQTDAGAVPYGADFKVGARYVIDDYITGVPSALSVTAGGSGYSDNTNVSTTGGTGSGLTVDTTTSGGVITSVVINSTGTGYLTGDIVTVSGGGADATLTITSASVEDFSGIGEVVSGTINTTGCIFRATGTTTSWSDSTISSLGDPTAIVLNNELGEIYFEYESTGTYTMRSVESKFEENKTWCTITAGNYEGNGIDYLGMSRVENDTIYIYSGYNGSNSDFNTGGAHEISIEVRVYDTSVNS